MGVLIRHEGCDSCGSSDAKAVYQDEDGSENSHCFSCNKTVASKEYIEAKNQEKTRGKHPNKTKDIMTEETKTAKSSKPVITPEQAQEIKDSTTYRGNGFREITDETSKFFGVRYAFSESTGEVEEQYYPCTQEGQLTGYKIREVPKNFRSIGRTGADCELFGQFRFNRGGKYVLVVEGELCALSAYQMLKDYNKARGSDFEIAVVSPTIGSNSVRQISNQYKFLDSFEFIILAFDSDKPGQEAAAKLIPHLPKGKVRHMEMRHKDHNEYLEKDAQKVYIQDFYAAKKKVPVGVLASGDLYDRIISQTEVLKVPFPSFMGELNTLFVGGMPLGHIINIAADTGVGKTTLVNEMIYYWIFHSPHTVGIVSMELDAGQYGEVLLSRHLSRKLALIPSVTEKLEYLQSDKVREQSKQMLYRENGEHRFYLLDNRDGSIEEIQDTIQELVVACGAKVIVLDPLQDILDGLSNEEQATFMKWAKGFIKSHNVLFVFINHMRKTPAGQSGGDNEQNIMGSSTIIKSASANILLKRDKMAEDMIVRNTTEISVPKNRVCGLTGPAGAAYYDNDTHTMCNLQEYLKEHGTTEF